MLNYHGGGVAKYVMFFTFFLCSKSCDAPEYESGMKPRFCPFCLSFFWQPLDIYGDSCYTLPRTLLDLLPRRSTIKFSVQCLCTLSVSDWKPYLCLVCLHCQNQILSPNSRSQTEVFQFHKCTNLILSGKEKNEK